MESVFFFLTQIIPLVVCSGLCVQFCEMWVKVISFGAGKLILWSVAVGMFCCYFGDRWQDLKLHRKIFMILLSNVTLAVKILVLYLIRKDLSTTVPVVNTKL